MEWTPADILGQGGLAESHTVEVADVGGVVGPATLLEGTGAWLVAVRAQLFLGERAGERAREAGKQGGMVRTTCLGSRCG